MKRFAFKISKSPQALIFDLNRQVLKNCIFVFLKPSVTDSNKEIIGIDGEAIPEPGTGSLVDDIQYWK